MATATVTAEQVRAHRILASGLHRTASTVAGIPGAALGWQDRDGSGLLSVLNRLADPGTVPAVGKPGGSNALALAWTLRGVPHLHRRKDLPTVAAALWPTDDEDAIARLNGDTSRLRASKADPWQAFATVSSAMRTLITAPMTKGDASAAVTADIPEEYSGWCERCGSTHVREQLFRLAALPGAIGLLPRTKPVELAPLSPGFEQPEKVGGDHLKGLVAEYYRMYGTGSHQDVGAFFGTSATSIRPAFPDDLVPIHVDGTRSRVPADRVQNLLDADVGAATEITRLLSQSDPVLQGRDRGVLTTDRDHRKELWPSIGQPGGAVLAGGGLAGTWRTRSADGGVTVTISSWRTLRAAEKTALRAEVELIGAVRGVADTRLVFG